MTRSRNNKKKKQQKAGMSGRSKANRVMVVRSGAPAMTPEAADYLRLLADPCKAKLVTAPYAGMGSSLVVRTTDYVQIAGGASDGTPRKFVFNWTPWNYSSDVTSGALDNANIGSVTLVDSASSNTSFLNTTAVKSFRPIAACLKWIPTGPVAARSGIIGMAYNPSKPVATGDVVAPEDLLALCQKVNSNGSVQHECLWLPSFGDERFSAIGEVNINGAGSVIVVGLNVDAQGTTSNMAAGYFECTAVWEWVPGNGNNLTVSPAAPSRTTLQQVLSTIRDVSTFVHKGMRAVEMGTSLISDFHERRGVSMPLAY